MTTATINRFVSLFHHAFSDLSCNVGMAQSERLAVVVHRAMESKTRAYHNSAHVFGMCEDMGSVQVLAALFHDVVYYQLDGGFPKHLAGLLHDMLRDEQGALLLPDLASDDEALVLCAALFGFASGQTLPLYGGMNEFLSAVVAARLLQPLLCEQDLIAVIACIEATIPFRRPCADGDSPASALERRVRRQAELRLPSLDSDGVQAFAQRVVADAIFLANRDVSGFGQADPALFLSSTWLLIEESNAPLTAAGGYSVQDYRGALLRMHTFLSHLNPANIFQGYGPVLPLPELVQWHARARYNIKFALNYLDAKLVTIAIIEALVLSTGMDCPVSMFLGDIDDADGKPERVEDFLPQVFTEQTLDHALLRVFDKGRAQTSSNDLTASPLTAYIYRHMGHEGVRRALASARTMFDGQATARSFLQGLPREMLLSISRACAQIALSRREALLALEAEL